MHNMQQQPNPSGGYYDSLGREQLTGNGYVRDSYSNRQDSYRPSGAGSQPRLYDPEQQRQNSYMQQGSERAYPAGAGGGYDDRQDSYRPSQGPPSELGGGGGADGYRQESYRGAPVSEQDYRQDSYRAPPSEQYGQDSYRIGGGGAGGSDVGGGGGMVGAYREDSYRQAPPSEHDSYRGGGVGGPHQTDLYGQHPGPPSEHDSYRPNHVDPYNSAAAGAPPSEQGSYRADPYAQVGQFDRHGGDEYGRGPPDGVEPPRQDYVPPGGVPLFPNHHAVRTK